MYWMELYNQKKRVWIDKAFKTLEECRVAGYKNVTETDAYKIPIRTSRTGKKVVSEVYKFNDAVECSIYDGAYLSVYVINKKGQLYRRIIRKPYDGFLEYER